MWGKKKLEVKKSRGKKVGVKKRGKKKVGGKKKWEYKKMVVKQSGNEKKKLG